MRRGERTISVVKCWQEWWNDDDDYTANAAEQKRFQQEHTLKTEKHDNKDTPNNTNSNINDVSSSATPQPRHPKLLLDVRTPEEWDACHFVSCTTATATIPKPNGGNYAHTQSDEHDDENVKSFSSSSPSEVFVVEFVVVHIPLSELMDRRFELPPRQTPFAILGSRSWNSLEEDPLRRMSRQSCEGNMGGNSPVVIVDDEVGSDGSLPDSTLFLNHLTEILSGERETKNRKRHKTGLNEVVARNIDTSSTTVVFSTENSLPLSHQRSTCPWNVTAVIMASNIDDDDDDDDDDTWRQACECGLSIQRHPREALKFPTSSPPEEPIFWKPEPRLWSPDSLLEQVLLPLLQKQLSLTTFGDGCSPKFTTDNETETVNNSSSGEQSLVLPPMQIWDLGAGVGRDVCFLAEGLRSWVSTQEALSDPVRPLTVVGLDQRYREIPTQETFWRRRHVDKFTASRCIDLSDTERVLTLLDEIQRPRNNASPSSNDRVAAVVQCIYAVRYWNRALFQRLIQSGRDNGLVPGTLIAISHFGKPYQGAPWTFPHPKEKHVLERNELNDLFTITPTGSEHSTASVQTNSTSGVCSWKILHDKVVLDSDHGRTLIQFVAQLL